jgi:hypothetical protein
MDLKLVKQRLEALNSQKTGGKKREKVDFSKIVWKPKVGKHVIRIVPSLIDKNNPFRELFVHYGFGKFPIFALTNWGESDPIVDFVSELRKTSDKQNWILAKKIEPKMRVYVPVVVRGEEHMGVRIWEIGKLIYQQFLQLIDDEDYGGDFTDIVEGRDFTITGVEDVTAGKKSIKCTVTAKPKTSPLTNDKELLDKLLAEQPDILAVQFKNSYDSLKAILEKWLDPAEEEATEEEEVVTTSDTESEEDETEEDETPVAPVADKKTKAPVGKKTNKMDKFDELFNNEK